MLFQKTEVITNRTESARMFLLHKQPHLPDLEIIQRRMDILMRCFGKKKRVIWMD
jgi:hypothetical protein